MTAAVRRAPLLAAVAFSTIRAAGPRLVAAIAALQLLSIASLVTQLFAARRIVADLSTGHPTHDLVRPALILVLAFGISAAATGLVTVVQHLLSERVSCHALAVVLQAATQTDLIEFESATLHDRLQRALLNAASRPTQMTLGLMSVASSLGSFVVLAVAVAVISPILFGVAVVVAIPLTFIALGSSRALFDFAVRQTSGDRQRLYLQLLLGSREQAKEVRAYGLGPTLLTRWRASYDERLGDLAVLLRTRALRTVAAVAVATIALAAGLSTLIWLITSDRLTFASGATAAAALLVMSRQAQTLASGTANLYETALFMQDYRYFAGQTFDATEATPGTTADAGPGRHRTAAVWQPVVEGSSDPAPLQRLTVKDLTFSYPSGHRAALTGVSLEIAHGEIVALVGENGSGKSTLAKVIAGLYDPQGGTIAWNGTDYDTLDLDAMRRQIAVLFQDFIKFQMSVGENIAMGDPTRTHETDPYVRQAAEMAGAADFITALPETYAAQLGPQFVGGTELSGGQWQRLALARAAYRPASLVILDEPTAALDPRAEERLFRATRDVFADRAVLLISHRFSSVRLADRIYVLADGRIVETGTHDSLMGLDGLYADLYRAQHEALLGPLRNARPRPSRVEPS